MPGLTSILRNLHALHQRLRDMREDTEGQSRQVKRNLANIDKHQKALDELHDAIKKVRVVIADRELTIKSNLQKILKHQEQLNQASSNKEYQALRTEIENEKLANKTLEDQILQAMEQIEEKVKQVPELEKLLAHERDELSKAEAKRDQWLAGQNDRLTSAATELKQLEEQLPGDLLGQYRRLIGAGGANGADALSALLGRSCAGCHMEMTAQMYNEVLVGKVVFCRSCGRLLYLTEG
jgi:hypothetical protein